MRLRHRVGLSSSPLRLTTWFLKLADRLLEDGIDKEIHPKSSRVLKRLYELADRPATLKEVERFRKLALDASI